MSFEDVARRMQKREGGQAAQPLIAPPSDSSRFGGAMLAAQRRNRRHRAFAMAGLLLGLAFAILLVMFR